MPQLPKLLNRKLHQPSANIVARTLLRCIYMEVAQRVVARREHTNELRMFGRQLASMRARGCLAWKAVVVLRTMSGEDLELEIRRGWTCRKVYQGAREILGLRARASPISLRLNYLESLSYARVDSRVWAVGDIVPCDDRLGYELLAGTVLGVVRY